MFDWPVATVLLGTLATVAVGMLKWKPRAMATIRKRPHLRPGDRSG